MSGLRTRRSRVVTHHVHHDAWLAEDELLRGLGSSTDPRCPSRRFDVQAPSAPRGPCTAPDGLELVVVDDAGRDASALGSRKIVRATDRFAL
jgi:hypothetical protein